MTASSNDLRASALGKSGMRRIRLELRCAMSWVILGYVPLCTGCQGCMPGSSVDRSTTGAMMLSFIIASTSLFDGLFGLLELLVITTSSLVDISMDLLVGLVLFPSSARMSSMGISPANVDRDERRDVLSWSLMLEEKDVDAFVAHVGTNLVFRASFALPFQGRLAVGMMTGEQSSRVRFMHATAV
ncbi:hypothetical protein BC943DRAFT_327239 [Umbelopsis sp. AD052]|nr:hypothetical protein BC943DRAFT_327239 [Umbelopsis sp. AD052]